MNKTELTGMCEFCARPIYLPKFSRAWETHDGDTGCEANPLNQPDDPHVGTFGHLEHDAARAIWRTLAATVVALRPLIGNTLTDLDHLAAAERPAPKQIVRTDLDAVIDSTVAGYDPLDALDDRAHETILAALRLYQVTGPPVGFHLEHDLMTSEEIDDLCIRLNCP